MSHLTDEFNETEMYGRPVPTPHQKENPLSRYYRMPGLHVNLPTQGRFMPQGSIEFTMSQEIPIFPMRGADEMLLKNPDALMSGYALEKLIESCAPAIRLPRQVSAPDLDVLLLAIRIVTYGDKMPLATECPKCHQETEFDCDLPTLLTTMKSVVLENTVRLSDEVVVYVRPFTLENTTLISLASFDEARRMQGIEAQKPDSRTRANEMSKAMERIRLMTMEAVAASIMKVVVPGTEVHDPSAIREFFFNIKKPWTDKIEAKVIELNGMGIDKKLHVVCSNKECAHEWDSEAEFDPASFFDVGSSV